MSVWVARGHRLGSGASGYVKGVLLRYFINNCNRLFELLTSGELQSRFYRSFTQFKSAVVEVVRASVTISGLPQSCSLLPQVVRGIHYVLRPH